MNSDKNPENINSQSTNAVCNAICSLCQDDQISYPIIDGEHTFCCTGCHAVFNILSAKNELGDVKTNPVFLQALKSGLIANPKLLDEIDRQKAEIVGEEREKLYLEIKEMWCPSCAEIIKLLLMNEKGVINCVVDYSTDLAAIEYSPRYLSKDKLMSIVNSFGYLAQALDAKDKRAVSKALTLRFAVASFCSLNVMMFAYPLYATYFSYDGEEYGALFAWLSFFVSLPVVFYSGIPIWRKVLNSLRTGIFGMEILVFIGVFSALILSILELIKGGTKVYFDTMTVIIAFVLLGKIVEARAKFSAKESLMRLTKASPRRARRRLQDGSLKFFPIKEIEQGHTLVVYAGERASLDGVIVEGKGAFDESLMTGESMPISKDIGDFIIGGSILVKGHLEYTVSGTYEESVLHKIIEMVEGDLGNKSVYVQAVMPIVRWFVPAVLSISVFTAFMWWLFPLSGDLNAGESALMHALAVLLISCPCAIGIAAPAAESYLLNGLASLGVIVRNRGVLRHFGSETTVIFDKTGTVTEGKYKVHYNFADLSKESIFALSLLVSKSLHPAACAIATSLPFLTFDQGLVEGMEEVVGFGLKGKIHGKQYFLGSERFLKMHGITLIKTLVKTEDNDVLSTVYFAENDQCLAEIKLGDRLRENVFEVIQALKPAKTILLSGDHEAVVAKTARLCGFDSWYSGCTPMEKREVVDSLKKRGEIVCMVGDGINDAPSLTLANVAISVVNATDMSIQVSDLLMTTDRLDILKMARDLSRKGQRIVRQNLFWAFFYNIVGILLAAFGVLTPIFAAFAMVISSLSVLFNSQRLS